MSQQKEVCYRRRDRGEDAAQGRSAVSSLYGRHFGLALAFGGLLLSLTLVLLLARSASIESHRDRLAHELAAGEIDLMELADAYHADAVSAFNRLSDREREEIAGDSAARYGRGTGPHLRLSKKATGFQLIHATWTDEVLFLLVRTPKRTPRDTTIPVRFGFRNPATPPSDDWIHLPPTTRPGVWLLSLRAPRKHIESLTIGALQHLEAGTHPAR